MPVAVCKDREGRIHEVYFENLRELPPFFQDFRGPGNELLRRVPTVPEAKVSNGEFVAHGVERWHPCAPMHDRHGRAVFRSQREVREFMAADPRWECDPDCGSESHLNDMMRAQEDRIAERDRQLEREDIHSFIGRKPEKVLRRMKHTYDELAMKHKKHKGKKKGKGGCA